MHEMLLMEEVHGRAKHRTESRTNAFHQLHTNQLNATGQSREANCRTAGQ